MNTEQVAYLCDVLDLGATLVEPEPVEGGSLHSVWRLRTAHGSFAVKHLKHDIMQQIGVESLYRQSERVAAACAALGVPAVAALPDAEGNVLQSIDGSYFLVYPWMDGIVLKAEAAAPEYARRIGAILAQIHGLHLQEIGLSECDWSCIDDEDWDILTCQAYDPLLPWAYPVRAAMPRLIEMTHAYETTSTTLRRHLVVGHNNLGQKNVLWQDAATPWIIDWESTALLNPTMELAGTALYWSGITVGEPDEGIFAATVDGYTSAGGVIMDSGIDAIHGCMGTWLGWLLFNMRRSLGESAGSNEERSLGVRESLSALTILRRMDRYADTWAHWLDVWY